MSSVIENYIISKVRSEYGVKMNILGGLVLVFSVLMLLTGIGASACQNCDQTYTNPITQGTVVHLQGPATSPQGRTLDYTWVAYNCTSGAVIDLYYTGGKLESGDMDHRDLYFYMPPAGEYRVALTVRDHLFPSTCYDTKSICFTTTYTCPTLCCQEICEASVPNYAQCPWHMSYSGPTGGFIFKWLIDEIPYEVGGTATSVNIDWTQSNLTGDGGVDIPLGVGLHQICFEIWANNPETGNLEMITDCDLSCSCSAGLTPCHVYKVEKPTANITLVT